MGPRRRRRTLRRPGLQCLPIHLADHDRDRSTCRGAKVVDGLRGRTAVDLTEDDVLESPHLFVDSVDGLVERFRMLRERLGITSFMVGDIDELAPVVERLAGT